MSVADVLSPQAHAFADESERSYSEAGGHDLAEDSWRQLAKIVRDVGPTLSPDEELGDLAAAEAAVHAKDEERGEVVDKLQEELRLLSRQHSLAASAAQRPAGLPSAAEHDSQVGELEQTQYSVGKQLNEEQANMGKKEVELGRWKSEKEEVGKWEVGDGDWRDGKIIRLKLLTEMGFTLPALPDENAPLKLLVRNESKSDIHPVMIEKSRSKAYYANLVWGLAGE